MIDEKTFLRWIILNDKSQPYEYGESRSFDDAKPEQGQKWLTPREMANLRLNEIVEKELEVVGDE